MENLKVNKKILIGVGVAFFAVAMSGAIIGGVIAESGIILKLTSGLSSRQFASLHDIDTSNTVVTEKYSADINYEDAVMTAVEKTSPAVVSIIISEKIPVLENCSSDIFLDLPQEFRRFFDSDAIDGSCQIETRLEEIGGGSGFVISGDGVILTNRHVISNKNASYTVITNDGKKYEAKILGQDPVFDLAIVKIDATNIPTVILGNSDSAKLGQTVIAIGNALGEFKNTVSMGVISGMQRSIVASGNGGGGERIEGLIQTDAAINSGNSGGPLLNLRGEVVGVNVATVVGAQNIGFAIPINQAKRAIESVKRSGEIVAPYLGIRSVTITDQIREQRNLSVDGGALVGGADSSGIVKNSPAEKAGMKDGDIILEVNNEKISSANSLTAVIQKYNVGDSVVIKVLRGEQELELRAMLEKRPEDF